MSRCLRRCFALVAVLAASVGLATAAPAPLRAVSATTEYQLDNGLKLIVREDHRAPVVVTQVWYRVGSSYEVPGQTGLSHALEHMMFKGTPRVPDGEFSRIVALYGGTDNAFTTDDYTGYYQLYAADKLPLALELEADRMQGLQLKPEAFAKEIQVVMEERRLRTDDSPQALAFERFLTLAYPTDPARNPTVGWMRDLQAMTVDTLRQWYAQWYVPNNATLVVVGDVQPSQVRDWAQLYFGAIAARPLPALLPPRELPEPGARVLDLSLPGKVPVLYLAFNVPSRNSGSAAEADALSMLLGVMDGGLSARLETRLVREQRVAAAVSSGYDAFARGDTLLSIHAVPAPGHSLDELQAAVLAEIEKLKTETITEDELKRVYAGLLSDQVFQQDSVQEQANRIGRLESVGLSWRVLEQWPQDLARVTPDAIRAVAAKYLQPARRSILRLQPQAVAATSATGRASGNAP